MQWKLDLWYCALVVYNLQAQALGILVIRFEFIPLIEAKSIRDSENSQAIRKNIVIDWNKLNSFRNMCLTNKTSEHSHSLKHHVQPPFVSKLPQVSCLEEKMESHLLAFTLPRLGIEGVWGSTLHCSRFSCRSRECRDNGKPSSATFDPTHWVTEGSKHLAVITPTWHFVSLPPFQELLHFHCST